MILTPKGLINIAGSFAQTEMVLSSIISPIDDITFGSDGFCLSKFNGRRSTGQRAARFPDIVSGGKVRAVKIRSLSNGYVRKWNANIDIDVFSEQITGPVGGKVIGYSNQS